MPGERQLAEKRTANLFKKIIQYTLKVPEKLSVSEWAEKYRNLGDTSAFGGRWTNDLTPYLVDIMDSFSDPYVREINFVKSTQVGGSEAMKNMLGYAITQSPAPAMIVYPTDDMAKEVSKDQLIPSLKLTKEIKEVFREQESKQLALKFQRMTVYLTGAGTPGKLANKPVRYLFIDEIDKLDGATKKEASPYYLARERTRTYPYSKKIFTCSTPTLKTNYVWTIHERAQVQKEYFMKCPHCGEYFVPDFQQIIFDKDEKKEASAEDRAQTAVYVCRDCGCTISNREKIKAVREGKWIAVKGKEVTHPQTISFHMNCLVSRFLTWEEIALEFLKSKDSPDELQNFVNSWLAQPWEDTRTKTSADLVHERETELKEFEVPDWTKLITAGVDVQKNCLYWSIRAFGDHITSQNIAHGQALSFEEIEQIMNLEYMKQNGEKYLVDLCLMDSGDQTDDVYDFTAMNSDWVMPCKGASSKMNTSYKFTTINKAGSMAKGTTLVLIDTSKYKDMIASRMQRPNGRGSWMVYQETDDEYCNQVTAEHKINVKNGKKIEKVWVPKRSHIDNHYLDCEVYAMCAADIKGVRTLSLHHEEEQKTQQQEVHPEENWIGQNDSWL